VALTLTVVTPERKILETEADEVSLPGFAGELGILPGHAALLTSLRTGVLTYRHAGRASSVVIQGGFCEVSDDRVNVLADFAEEKDDINPATAKAAKAAAEAAMASSAGDELEAARAAVELNDARIKVAEGAPAGH
jgi:F-type H+-transporting ATPase subunit epsilon